MASLMTNESFPRMLLVQQIFAVRSQGEFLSLEVAVEARLEALHDVDGNQIVRSRGNRRVKAQIRFFPGGLSGLKLLHSLQKVQHRSQIGGFGGGGGFFGTPAFK